MENIWNYRFVRTAYIVWITLWILFITKYFTIIYFQYDRFCELSYSSVWLNIKTTSSESVINYGLVTYNHKLKTVYIIRHNIIIIMVILFVSDNMNIVTFRKRFNFFWYRIEVLFPVGFKLCFVQYVRTTLILIEKDVGATIFKGLLIGNYKD